MWAMGSRCGLAGVWNADDMYMVPVAVHTQPPQLQHWSPGSSSFSGSGSSGSQHFRCNFPVRASHGLASTLAEHTGRS